MANEPRTQNMPTREEQNKGGQQSHQGGQQSGQQGSTQQQGRPNDMSSKKPNEWGDDRNKNQPSHESQDKGGQQSHTGGNR